MITSDHCHWLATLFPCTPSHPNFLEELSILQILSSPPIYFSSHSNLVFGLIMISNTALFRTLVTPMQQIFFPQFLSTVSVSNICNSYSTLNIVFPYTPSYNIPLIFFPSSLATCSLIFGLSQDSIVGRSSHITLSPGYLNPVLLDDSQIISQA